MRITRGRFLAIKMHQAIEKSHFSPIRNVDHLSSLIASMENPLILHFTQFVSDFSSPVSARNKHELAHYMYWYINCWEYVEEAFKLMI